jgi:uncharacterized membrane protein
MICYFDDMLAGFVILGFSNFMLIIVSKPIIKFRYMILFVLCCGCIWEFLAPVFKSSCVTDYYDFVAYIVGCTIYYFTWKLINRNSSTCKQKLIN